MHEKTRPNAGSGIKSCLRVLQLGEWVYKRNKNYHKIFLI